MKLLRNEYEDPDYIWENIIDDLWDQINNNAVYADRKYAERKIEDKLEEFYWFRIRTATVNQIEKEINETYL